MHTHTTKRHVIEVEQGHGSVWIVRVFQKRPLFRKLISSDWFLDADQAGRFVEELKPWLDSSDTTDLLVSRKPGWTLRRPTH